MQTTSALKVQPLLQDAQNFVVSTNISEFASFFAILESQVNQIASTPVHEIPIIFIGLPDAAEQKQLKEYIGQDLADFSSFYNTPFKVATSPTIPIRLYSYKNINKSQWMNRVATPGILLLFKNGLSNAKEINELLVLVNKLPLLKAIHTDLAREVLQKLQQATGAFNHKKWSSLGKSTILSDIQQMSSIDAINKMKDFLMVSEINSNTYPMLVEKTKEFEENHIINRQQVEQKKFRLKQSINTFSASRIAKQMEEITKKRLGKFKDLLGKDLDFQLHPSKGQLNYFLDAKLSLLDTLEKKQEGKDSILAITDSFKNDMIQALENFYTGVCREHIELANSYLKIVQRELKMITVTHGLNAEIDIPVFLEKDKMDQLIGETTQTSSSVPIPKAKKITIRVMLGSLFTLLMVISLPNRLPGNPFDGIYDQLQDFLIPIAVILLGYLIYNFWSKDQEEKETQMVNGITDVRKKLKNNLTKNATTYASTWTQLLTDRLDKIFSQWKEQIIKELDKEEQKKKEELVSEKINIQLKEGQLGQKERTYKNAKIKLFGAAISRRELKITKAYADARNILNQLFVNSK